MAVLPDLFGNARFRHLGNRIEEVVSKVDRLLELAYVHIEPVDAPVHAAEPSRPLHLQRSPKGFSGDNVAVAGIFKTRCGLQRAADLIFLEMQRSSKKACAIDLSDRLGTPLTLERSDVEGPDYARTADVSDIIIALNPPLFTAAFKQFVSPNGERPNIIGYWVWELNKVSDDWRFAASLCDEIWVPSDFNRSTFEAELPEYKGLVKTIPYSVDLDPVETYSPQKREEVRAKFGHEDGDFVVGTTFSFSSCYSRKNPTAAIDAFWAAFGTTGSTRHRMVVRCTDSHVAPKLLKHLISYASEDPRVRIVRGDVEGWRIWDFFNSLDAYISLHRSEGYGLTLVEAAQVGLPVVTTGWGLAADIARRPGVHAVGYRLIYPIDYQNLYEDLDGALWAEPDFKQAGQLLLDVYEASVQTRHEGAVARSA